MNATPAPAIIDVEASGFGRGSYPIEVGFVLSDGSCFCSLVRPATHWTHWDTDAEAMHRISREALMRHGRSVAEIVAILNDKLHGLTVFSDGWGHDFVWLSLLFDEANRVPAFRLQHLALLLDESRADRWNTVREEVESAMRLQRHRASNDARVLQMTWRRLFDAGSETISAT